MGLKTEALVRLMQLLFPLQITFTAPEITLCVALDLSITSFQSRRLQHPQSCAVKTCLVRSLSLLVGVPPILLLVWHLLYNKSVNITNYKSIVGVIPDWLGSTCQSFICYDSGKDPKSAQSKPHLRSDYWLRYLFWTHRPQLNVIFRESNLPANKKNQDVD